MTYMRIDSTATIHVPDHKNLIAAWKRYGGPLTLVGSFIVEKPLTDAQLQCLPRELRGRVKCPSA
jgi:hypothetical protein